MTQSSLEVTKAIGFIVAEQAASSGDSAVPFALTGLAATPEEAALQPRSCSTPRASSAPTAPAVSPAQGSKAPRASPPVNLLQLSVLLLHYPVQLQALPGSHLHQLRL